MSDHDTGYVDDDYLTDTCRQCGQIVAVRPDEERPDGPYICDACVRVTTNRAANRSPFSNYLMDTALTMARMLR